MSELNPAYHGVVGYHANMGNQNRSCSANVLLIRREKK